VAPPENVVCLYAEYRRKNNGGRLSERKSLRDVMLDNGLPFMSEQRKELMRKLILTGDWEVIEQHKKEILSYCAEDVDANLQLLRRIHNRLDLPRALLRGRYMMAASAVEWVGTPIDVAWWQRFVALRKPLLGQLIDRQDSPYQVYGTERKFSHKRFGRMLERRGIPWLKTEKSGLYLLKDKYFKDQCRTYPELEPLRQLRKVISVLKEPKLTVGTDGRNRTPVAGFGAGSGRNAPKAAKNIWGYPRFLRGLIRPPEGVAVAYIDWEAQEIAIAAALSRDENLKGSYLSGDPYLDFAKSVGLVPPDATKKTHWRVREACKVLMLGVNYGMSEIGLAARLKGLDSLLDAADLLLRHKRHYSVYWAWSKSVVERADLGGFIQTMFGWRMWVTDKTTERTLMNFPMQATGAEMMRIAAIALTEMGIQVCSIIHDAFLVEAPIPAIGAVTGLAEGIMQETGYRLLGFPIRTEATVVCYPDRYMDARPGSAEMWGEVDQLLGELEVQEETTR
jgi:hypothetical protein